MNSHFAFNVRCLNKTRFVWSLIVLFFLASPEGLKSQQVPITAVSMTPNGQLLTGSDNGLQLHNAQSLKLVKRIETGIEKVYSIKFSPDRTKFAISGGSPADIGVVEVFQAETFKVTHQFGRCYDVATECVWVSNEQLIGCSMTGNCCLMPLNNHATKPFNVHSKGILSMAMLDSGIMVTAGLDNTIGVWESENPAALRVLNNHVDVVNQIAVRPTDQKNAIAMIVTVSDDATVRFWQPEIGRMVRFARLESIPTCVVWNQAGTRAVVGTRSGKIHFVDPASATIDQTVNATGWINCLALSPDENTIFVGGENGLHRVEVTAK